MSSHNREEESTTSADLKFTMEAMIKQFERCDKLFQQNIEFWERIEERMTEIERRSQPIHHPRRQEKHAPIFVFVEDYLKIRKEYETKRSFETARSIEKIEQPRENNNESERK